jgi:hypothetical protein
MVYWCVREVLCKRTWIAGIELICINEDLFCLLKIYCN